MARRAKLAVVPEPTPSELEAAVDDYLATIRAQGLALTTERYYSNILGKVWLPWAREHGITSFEQLDQRALDQFNDYLLNHRDPPLKRSSVASYLRATRTWLTWTQREKLTDGLKVRNVKLERKVLDTLSREDIAAIEAAAVNERDKLIVRLMGDTGIRLNELLTLKPTSLIEQGRDRYLKVEGKGSKQRLVPLKPILYARLKRYAEKGRPDDCNTDRIFIQLRRKHGLYERLDARGVEQALQVIAHRAGIRKPTNPHAFRHAFATNALRRGVNPLILQKILGHADLSMISNTYSHLVAEDTSREVMRILGDD